jgi:hypothetical protein
VPWVREILKGDATSMKKFFVCLVMICLALCGCESNNKNGTKTTTEKVKTTTESVETTTDTTSAQEAEYKVVQFDENNAMKFGISSDASRHLMVLCTFDGVNPSVEYMRCLCAISASGEYGFSQKLFMVITSGDKSGMVRFGVGGHGMEFPETYITPDESKTVKDEAFEKIRKALSELLNG